MFISPPHDQHIYFDDGTIRIIRHVTKIEQGRWFHIMTKEGIEYITNPSRILFIKVCKLEKHEHDKIT